VGIRESVRAREDLMAIVAHDLRNPLSAIILRSKIASEKLPPCTNADFIKGTLERINHTARHMNELVGDLNLAAQFEAGRLAVDLQPCSFKQAIEPAIERLGLLAQEKDITLEVKDEQAAGEVLSADFTRLSQIFSNLIGNAIKFTPKGGTVCVAAENRDDEVLFRISDTGPGIDAEALPHIFEKFWQVRTTGSGMGLGLFITKLLVEAHHGRIWISSSPEVGTTFHFTIPKSAVLHSKLG
jgi:signal transduction histidine kinase